LMEIVKRSFLASRNDKSNSSFTPEANNLPGIEHSDLQSHECSYIHPL
jgi:hypothetical protein